MRKEQDMLAIRSQLEEVKMARQREAESEARRREDEGPLNEMKQALLAAQDDLQGKADEAAVLSAKVERLEEELADCAARVQVQPNEAVRDGGRAPEACPPPRPL